MKNIQTENTLEEFDRLMPLAEKLVKDRIRGERKGLPGEHNYLHSFRVKDLVMHYHHWDDGDNDLFIAALLHDIVEDGGVTYEELNEIGFTDRTIELVRLCSHDLTIDDSTERWVLMIAKLIKANNEDAWRIKIADLADNLTQCHGLSLENRKFMIEVKAPLLLRLSTKSYSAWGILEDVMKRQRMWLEAEINLSSLPSMAIDD